LGFDDCVDLQSKNEHDKAIADYDEAIRLDPHDAVAYRQRGCSWSARMLYDRSIADFNGAIRLNPQYALAYANRGSAWLNRREFDLTGDSAINNLFRAGE
jgi:tetratricopeptide (TPR) repeat protein